MTDIKNVLEERANSHGDFSFVATVAQDLKDTLRSAAYESLEPWQTEALDMIVSKIGRIIAGNPNEPDHWLDIEGYARLARERINTDG